MSIGVGMVQPFFNVFLKDLGASDNQVGFILCSRRTGGGGNWTGGANAWPIALAPSTPYSFCACRLSRSISC